jgi:hypothetical protein
MIVSCPHCQDLVYIDQLNCRIFRHGIFKQTYEQIPPHSPKAECDRFVEQDLIYGCGKPFKIEMNGQVIICDYI